MEVDFVNCVRTECLSTSFDVCHSHVFMCERNVAKLTDVFSITDESLIQDIILQGHHSNISAFRFVTLVCEEISLITASSDYVIIWHLNEVTSNHKYDEVVRGHILYSPSEAPCHIGYLDTFNLICIVSNTCIVILDALSTMSNKVVASVEIRGLILAEFLNKCSLIAVSCSGQIFRIQIDGNHYMTPDIVQTFCSDITSLTAHWSGEYFSVGFSNALIHEFAYHNKLQQYKQFMKVDLDESFLHYNEMENLADEGDQSSGNVLALRYVSVDFFDEGMRCTGNPRHLLCATKRTIYLINCNNQKAYVKNILDQYSNQFVARHVCFEEQMSGKKILCIASSLIDPQLLIFSISLPTPVQPLEISMISNAPLLTSSPLHAQSKLSKPIKSKNDKPITFKSKIKSSGYTAAPRMTMFKPNTSISKRKPTKPQPSFSTPSKPSQSPPATCSWHESIEICERIVVCPGDYIINSIAMNGRTKMVACTLSDSSVNIAKLPLSNFNQKSKVITGHSKHLLGCDWSHDKDILMTYSRNKEIKLWCTPYSNGPCLSFQVECSEKIAKELIHAQFYYLDKFILAGVGNSISLIKYALNEEKKDEVKRYLNKGKHKVVGKWAIGSAQNMTCVTSPNNFYSYAALCCGSDRSITVFDFNNCKEVFTLKDAHTRPAHTIQYSLSPSSSTVECFITSAPNDGIKLWDLRMQNCVRKFQQHQSTTKCEVSFSGCGNFIATATDRKSVCVYDNRKSFIVQEFSRKTKITSLAFTPDSSQLLLGDDSSTMELLGPT